MSIVNALNVSVAGMSAQANALTATGSNIANSTTVGYKNAGTQFEAMLDRSPSAVLASGAVQTDVRYGIASQGVLQQTQSSTDLAVNGNGFFAVSYQGQGTHLTRAGNFVADASGNLVNAAGYQLMGYAAGSSTLSPVNVAGSAAVRIGGDGTLTQIASDGTAAATYNIPLANVISTNNLTTKDGDVYDVSATSGAMTLSSPGDNGTGSIRSNYLEQSTVDLGTELTNMIVTQRSYEANSKALQTSSDLIGILKNLSTS